jgi:hypothetical protein
LGALPCNPFGTGSTEFVALGELTGRRPLSVVQARPQFQSSTIPQFQQKHRGDQA